MKGDILTTLRSFDLLCFSMCWTSWSVVIAFCRMLLISSTVTCSAMSLERCNSMQPVPPAMKMSFGISFTFGPKIQLFISTESWPPLSSIPNRTPPSVKLFPMTVRAWRIGNSDLGLLESFWLCLWKRMVSRAKANGRPILHLLKNGLTILWRFSFLFVPQPGGIPDRHPRSMCTFSWQSSLTTFSFRIYQPFISAFSHFFTNWFTLSNSNRGSGVFIWRLADLSFGSLNIMEISYLQCEYKGCRLGICFSILCAAWKISRYTFVLSPNKCWSLFLTVQQLSTQTIFGLAPASPNLSLTPVNIGVTSSKEVVFVNCQAIIFPLLFKTISTDLYCDTQRPSGLTYPKLAATLKVWSILRYPEVVSSAISWK